MRLPRTDLRYAAYSYSTPRALKGLGSLNGLDSLFYPVMAISQARVRIAMIGLAYHGQKVGGKLLLLFEEAQGRAGLAFHMICYDDVLNEAG